jgi:TonB family protein
MLVHGLRLLVALVTFAFGVTASWLLGSGGHRGCAKRGAVAERVFVQQMREEIPPPPAGVSPKRECKLSLSPQLVEGGILNGKANSLPTPAYPAAARGARVGGSVPVRVVVDVDGSVSSAEALGGPKLLRRAAEDAAREALFAPTLLSGRPVMVGGVINYTFSPQ